MDHPRTQRRHDAKLPCGGELTSGERGPVQVGQPWKRFFNRSDLLRRERRNDTLDRATLWSGGNQSPCKFLCVSGNAAGQRSDHLVDDHPKRCCHCLRPRSRSSPNVEVSAAHHRQRVSSGKLQEIVEHAECSGDDNCARHILREIGPILIDFDSRRLPRDLRLVDCRVRIGELMLAARPGTR
jgi:hypothetical protein